MSQYFLRKAATVMCIASLALPVSWAVAATSAPGGEVIKEIAAMDAKVDGAHSKAGVAALESDQLIDIHGSGWLYTKAENLGLGSGAGPDIHQRKIIKSEKTPVKYVVFNDGAVLETWVSTDYYEVPDPEEQAKRLGTLEMDVSAMAKARAVMGSSPVYGPGESEAPNPYRVRKTRLWVRESGGWKIGLDQSTHVGVRSHPGF